MGGAAVRIPSPPAADAPPNRPSSVEVNSATIPREAFSKTQPDLSKSLYRELSDNYDDQLKHRGKKRVENDEKKNSVSVSNTKRQDAAPRENPVINKQKDAESQLIRKNLQAAANLEQQRQQSQLQVPKATKPVVTTQPVISVSIPPRPVSRIVPLVPPPPSSSPHGRKSAPSQVLPPTVVILSEMKTPGRNPHPSPKSASPIHSAHSRSSPSTHTVIRLIDTELSAANQPPSPLLLPKQLELSHTVKDTTNVCRKRAQLPSSPPHPKPIAGSWLSKRVIVNNYIILDLLGTGSYAEVRLCKDRKTNKLYAMKIITKHVVDDKKTNNSCDGNNDNNDSGGSSTQDTSNSSNGLSDIRREIAVMKKLSHPNVVRLYEVMDDPNVNKLYLVLEYMRNGDMMHAMNEGDALIKYLNDDRVHKIFKQVASGIAYLHKQNIVHGDIKPQNLLVSDDGTVKLADFGISKMLHFSSQKLNESIGTPAFMSPEICSGVDYSGQLADAWALGGTIYMLRFGHPPFVASSVISLYKKIINDEVSYDFAISTGLSQILSCLLTKAPLERMTIDGLMRHPWMLYGPMIDVQLGRSGASITNGSSGSMPEIDYDVVSVSNHDIYQSINQVTISKTRNRRTISGNSNDDDDDDDLHEEDEVDDDDRCLDEDETDKRSSNFKKMMNKRCANNDNDDDEEEDFNSDNDDDDDDVRDAFMTLPAEPSCSLVSSPSDDDDDGYKSARIVTGSEVSDILDTLSRQRKRPSSTTQVTSNRHLINLDWSCVTVSGRLRNRRSCVGIACISLRGNRDTQEDRLFVVTDVFNAIQHLNSNDVGSPVVVNNNVNLSDVSIAAIFDGHGGVEGSSLLSEKLIQNLLVHKAFPSNIKQSIVESFSATDKFICSEFRNSCPQVGSTALVAVHCGDSNTLHVANVGDSICVLSRGGRAVRVNRPHRVISNDDERNRIISNGGCIANNRLNGSLAITRSFGDVFHKDNANQLIAVPEIEVQIVTAQTEFALLASDGLWDVLHDQEAIDFIRSQLTVNNDLHVAIQKLGQFAMTSGSLDNITIIIIGFHMNF